MPTTTHVPETEARLPATQNAPHATASTDCIQAILTEQIKAGDITDCLSNDDIDRVLGPALGRRYVPAIAFYEFRTGARTQADFIESLDDAMERSSADHDAQWIFMPVHLRHHWMAAIISRGRKCRTVINILDSAPSPITRHDLQRQIGRLSVPHAVYSPLRQPWHSNQCGLFTVLFGLVARHSHVRLIREAAKEEPSELDLGRWRQMIPRSIVPEELLGAVELPSWMASMLPTANVPPQGNRDHGSVSGIGTPDTTAATSEQQPAPTVSSARTAQSESTTSSPAVENNDTRRGDVLTGREALSSAVNANPVLRTRRNDPYAPAMVCRECRRWPCQCSNDGDERSAKRAEAVSGGALRAEAKPYVPKMDGGAARGLGTATVADGDEGPTAEDDACRRRRLKLLRDARAYDQHEIRAKLRGMAVGTLLRVVWRQGECIEEWCGTLGELVPERSTARTPTWRISYFAGPEGPLTGDDDVSIITERGYLPSWCGEEIIAIEHMDPSQPGDRGQSDGDDARTRTDVPKQEHASAHVQQCSYSRVPDGPPADIDAAQWTHRPRDISPQQYHEAPINAGEFLDYELYQPEEARTKATEIVWSAVCEAVRHGHIAELRELQEHARQQGDAARNAPLDALLVHYYQHKRHAKQWRYSTLSRHLGTCVGALTNLSLYAKNGRGLNPIGWARFRATMQTAKRLATAEGIREPKLASPETIVRAVDAAADEATKALIVACFFTAQRPCDVLNTKRAQWRFEEDGRILVQLTQGKTVASQGTHHIHTVLKDNRLNAILRKHVEAATKSYVWPIATPYQRAQAMERLRSALRAADPELEARSLRRSTLCAMAAAGANEQELLAWSRHKSVEMLRRYLYFERVPHREHANMQRMAAEALLPARAIAGGGTDSITLGGVVTVNADGDSFFQLRAPKDPRRRGQGSDHLPIHIGKRPGIEIPVTVALVDGLATKPPPDHADRIAWQEDREVLRDRDGRHAALVWNGKLEVAKLTRADVDVLARSNMIKRVDESEMKRVRGTVLVFPKEEPDKHRKRAIFWTRNYNDTYPTEEVAPNRGNSTRAVAREAILPSEGACHSDYAAYYPSIPIEDDVSFTECFITSWGEVYRNLRCATGKRPHASMATSMTRILAYDPQRPETVIFETAIDGIRYAGTKEACTDALWGTVQRSRDVNARMNDIDVYTATRDTVAEQWKTRDADWIGDVVDFEKKTIRCRDTHVERLDRFAAQVRRPEATHADVFRLWAMVLYMADTLAMPLYEHRHMRDYIRRAAQLLYRYPHLWESRCVERPPAQIYHAVEICRANRPATLVPAPPIDTVVVTDASADGWAAVVARRDSGGATRLEHFQRRWDPNTLAAYDMAQSAKAEPEALARAAEYVRRRYPAAAILAATDHHGMVDAFAKGYAQSPVYDTRIARLMKARVDTVAFIPGDGNPADGLSRFLTSTLSPRDEAAAVEIAQRFLGRPQGRSYRLRPA
jgi:hypothetical protein